VRRCPISNRNESTRFSARHWHWLILLLLAAYLDGACAGDASLRARIGALLVAHGQIGSFPKLPGGGLTAEPVAPMREAGGSMIDRYKLLEQIGEGGFGVVFMAEQDLPVRRRVALKIIEAGMDTRQVIARFDQA
jgi:hypothetical protein